MKKTILLGAVLLTLTSCWEAVSSSDETMSTEYTPVLMKRSDFEAAITLQGSKSIKNYGKIYRKGDLLFINERYEGVHVIDNADPTNPTHIGFISIPGNVDIAMSGNTIYADNITDLIAITYANDKIEVQSRQRGLFPEPVPPDLGYIPAQYSADKRPEDMLIVKWEKQ